MIEQEKLKSINIDDKLQSKFHLIKPYLYFRPSISAVIIRILILLSLQVIALFFTKSYSAIFVILASVLGAACAAALDFLLTKKPLFNIMNILTQGLLLGLLIPENYPVITIFFISFFSLFISQTIFFKSINNWFNVPAIAVIIAWFIGRNYFPEFLITSDIISLRNSSVYLIQNGSFPIFDFDSTITNFLNTYVFNIFDITVPEGFISLFWDTHSAIPAFRFNFITIISSIILFSDNAFSGIIPWLFLIVYGLLVRLFSPFIFGGSLNQGDILLAILTSGTLFCVTFLIQWYGTVPITTAGKILLGLISGIFAFLIIGCGTSPVGMVFTVLLTNFTNLIIRSFEEVNNSLSTASVISKLLSKGDN